MSTNDKGEPMLKHAPLGDAYPVEVREAQCVGGPLAVLDDYYGVYAVSYTHLVRYSGYCSKTFWR